LILDSEYPPEIAACQLAFEVSSLAAGILTLKGRPVWFSSAFPAMLGYTLEEFSGQSAVTRIHPDDLPAFLKRVDEATAGSPTLETAERRYQHKDGHYLWIRVSTNFIRNAAGEPTHILGIFQDITDRKNQETNLQETKNHLNTILESVKDVVWSFSAEQYKLTYMNKDATKAIYLRAPEDFYQNPELWMQVVHPEDRALVGGIWKRLSLGPTEDYYRILRPNSEVRWVHAFAWATKDTMGNPIRFEGIVRDVTDTKLSEIEIEAQRQKLAAAAKMSALGQMAGGLAHEIINPLAIIHGNAQVLKQQAAQNSLNFSNLIDTANTIEQTTDRISKIVKSLRTFARDVAQDPFQKMAIATIVAETAELCRARFESRKIDFRIKEIDPQLEIACRPVQISQVLLNLLNNAFDAVENLTDPWVEISAADDGSYVKIFVTDMGPGIPAGLQEKIFQPFFTTKDIGKGTGLGLSVSSGIIETHSGSLTLDTALAYTRFVARLP
jgi:PAS domain S-box-containing protein